jgi:hypothetical protein
VKLLHCAWCGDFISPYRENHKPRTCQCGRYTVWWENNRLGVLRVRDNTDDRRYGWVIGLHNGLLELPEPIKDHHIAGLLAECPDTYIFKRIGSLVIRIRPGESNDTAWVAPEGESTDG